MSLPRGGAACMSSDPQDELVALTVRVIRGGRHSPREIVIEQSAARTEGRVGLQGIARLNQVDREAIGRTLRPLQRERAARAVDHTATCSRTLRVVGALKRQIARPTVE